MKNILLKILLLLLAVAPFTLQAATEAVPHDTVYFYDTWAQMLYRDPAAMIVDPFIEEQIPCQVFFFTNDEKINKMIQEDHMAASVGDSIWFVSSHYLDEHFKGGERMVGFVPVFFNEKVAFVTYTGRLSVKDILFGGGDDYEYSYSIDLYYLDFMGHRVEKVTHEYLSELLEDYHDLQVRYEGMKDYKKRYIIEDYFYKYIERATQDIMRPYLLDLVE